MSLTRDRLRSRLADLGLQLSDPVAAKGRYLPACVDGDRLWVSGHTGRTPASPALVGVVGDDVAIEDALDSARTAAVNLLVAATSVVEPGRVTGVVFLRGYVRAAPSFGRHPEVVDAASEVLEHVLDGGGHARAALGVASLPGGACVELEAVFGLGA